MSGSELEHFYEAHIEKIYRFFFYKTLRREIAEDLTSQCFLKFVKEANEGGIHSPKAFLYGIARHIFMDYLRAKYTGNEVALNEEISDMQEADLEEGASVDVIDLLSHVLPALPEKQALVLRLRFVDKLSLEEIAKKLGKDTNYVSTTQKRGLKSVKNYLQCTDTPTNILE